MNNKSESFPFVSNYPHTYGTFIAHCSYIDHGNGRLCLRINDAFDIDSGIYSCQVFTSDINDSTSDSTFDSHSICSLINSGCSDCSSSGELCVLERDIRGQDEECVQLLKTPLPVVCASGDEALFYARVFPCDAEADWYLNGQLLAQADDSLNMTVRMRNKRNKYRNAVLFGPKKKKKRRRKQKQCSSFSTLACRRLLVRTFGGENNNNNCVYMYICMYVVYIYVHFDPNLRESMLICISRTYEELPKDASCMPTKLLPGIHSFIGARAVHIAVPSVSQTQSSTPSPYPDDRAIEEPGSNRIRIQIPIDRHKGVTRCHR